MNILKKNGGFTLVELIVVIAILAILAGVAVPAYSGYIKSANDAAVTTELSALKTAVMAANAIKGEVTAIDVDDDGVTVTITTSNTNLDATNFATDFNTFYGITGTALATVNGKTITLPTASKIDFTNTTYDTKGAEWSSTGTNAGEWVAGTP